MDHVIDAWLYDFYHISYYLSYELYRKTVCVKEFYTIVTRIVQLLISKVYVSLLFIENKALSLLPVIVFLCGIGKSLFLQLLLLYGMYNVNFHQI